MFRITGRIYKEEESITYEQVQGKGTIQGDSMVMFLMKNALLREIPVGPAGQYLDRNLDEPMAALFMILECFDEVLSWEGELPTAEELPEGVSC